MEEDGNMATFRQLLSKTLKTGAIQIKDIKPKEGREDQEENTGRYSIPFVDKYMSYLFKMYKSDFRKVRKGIFQFIKDDSYGLDRELEPQDPIEMSKAQFISALFFIGRNKLKNSDWYDNKLEDEKKEVFEEFQKHCKSEYPNFIADVTNKNTKDKTLPEIIIK